MLEVEGLGGAGLIPAASEGVAVVSVVLVVSSIVVAVVDPGFAAAGVEMTFPLR